MIRRAARRDENEPEIVQALEAVGATVERLTGDGLPDLLVGWRGQMWLLEVKLTLTARGSVQPGRHRNHSGGQGDKTAAQVAWWAWWKGPPPVVVRSSADALAAIGAVLRDTDLPPELLPDALAIHMQRKPRC